MTERQSREVERVLLHISDARTRAGTATDALVRDGAPPHIVEALRDAEIQLGELHRNLMQATYYVIVDPHGPAGSGA